MSTVTFPNGQSLASSGLTPDGCNNLFQPLIASILGIDPVAQPVNAYSVVRVGWQEQGQPGWGPNDDVCIIRSTLVDDPFARIRDEFVNPNDSVSLSSQSGFTQVWNLHLTLYGPNGADRARLILSAMALDWVHDWTVGPITAASVAVGGTGYVVGDVVGVTQATAYSGSLSVASIGSGGVATGMALVPAQQGIGYSTASALPTTGGTGTGLTVNITSSNLYRIVATDRPVYIGETFQGLTYKRCDVDIKFNELVIESTLVSSAIGADITVIEDAGPQTTIHLRVS